MLVAEKALPYARSPAHSLGRDRRRRNGRQYDAVSLAWVSIESVHSHSCRPGLDFPRPIGKPFKLTDGQRASWS